MLILSDVSSSTIVVLLLWRFVSQLLSKHYNLLTTYQFNDYNIVGSHNCKCNWYNNEITSSAVVMVFVPRQYIVATTCSLAP